MTVSFEDILGALCSQVKTSLSNDFQKVLLLGDVKEARLAFDILVAYGFDAKVYPPEDDEPLSKLYITLPGADADNGLIAQKMSAALAHAKALKTVKHALDTLYAENGDTLQSPDYSIAFANAPTGGKQTLILYPGKPLTVSAPAAVPQTPKPAAAPAAAATPATRKVVKKPTKEENDFEAGPSLAKRNYPKNMQADQNPDSLKKQLALYMKGNAARAVSAVVLALVVLAVLFTIFTFSKSFLCPDFASTKRNDDAWYCQNPAKQPEPDNTPGKLKKSDLFKDEPPQ